MHGNSKLKPEIIEDVKEMYCANNEPLSIVAGKFSVSISTMWAFMRRNGITVRDSSTANKISTNRPEVKAKRIASLIGKPSGAAGKSWKVIDRKPLGNGGQNNPFWRGGLMLDQEYQMQQRRNHKAIRRGNAPNMPKWANKENIAAIYKEARILGQSVDHIIPLTHRLVSGLHCEANLQIMPMTENRKKGNRIWPDMP